MMPRQCMIAVNKVFFAKPRTRDDRYHPAQVVLRMHQQHATWRKGKKLLYGGDMCPIHAWAFWSTERIFLHISFGDYILELSAYNVPTRSQGVYGWVKVSAARGETRGSIRAQWAQIAKIVVAWLIALVCG